MKANTVRVVLRQHATREGGQRALARKLGVSVSFINKIVKGTKEPSGKVLTYLGLQRVVTYVPLDVRAKP